MSKLHNQNLYQVRGEMQYHTRRVNNPAKDNNNFEEFSPLPKNSPSSVALNTINPFSVPSEYEPKQEKHNIVYQHKETFENDYEGRDEAATVSGPDEAGGPSARSNKAPETSFEEVKELVLRSSEIDPSVHQMEISTPEVFLMSARICGVLHSCANTGRGVKELNPLIGHSRASLEGLLRAKGEVSVPTVSPSKRNTVKPEIPNSSEPRRHVIVSLLECSDDLILEKVLQTETKSGKIEVLVFRSENSRQFTVAFQGPVQGKQRLRNAKKGNMGGRGIEHLHTNNPSLPVTENLCDMYFSSALEQQLFEILNELSSSSPFFDVVMTGYSFGAALATMASVRYAAQYPMMTVMCHCYASPRIGGTEFRDFVHSLPNLRIIRIENKSDPYVFFPNTSNSWKHVGHTITIEQSGLVKAYRFDKYRKTPGAFRSVLNSFSKKAHLHHEIREYIHAIEQFTHLGKPWITDFVGYEGNGIRVVCGKSQSHEIRTIT